MTCEGENIESDVYAIERDEEDFNVVTVSFGDEYMMESISGNVSCSIYDAIEKDLSDLGFEIIETDGCDLKLSFSHPKANLAPIKLTKAIY